MVRGEAAICWLRVSRFMSGVSRAYGRLLPASSDPIQAIVAIGSIICCMYRQFTNSLAKLDGQRRTSEILVYKGQCAYTMFSHNNTRTRNDTTL